MKYNTIILTVVLCAASLIAWDAKAQGRNDMSHAERHHQDSLETASRNEARQQKTKNENRMADARNDRSETREYAKEAGRIQKDAKLAAREARLAVKSERKAQKARKKATKQAGVAETNWG